MTSDAVVRGDALEAQIRRTYVEDAETLGQQAVDMAQAGSPEWVYRVARSAAHAARRAYPELVA